MQTYLDEQTYQHWYQQSINDPETFWNKQANELITWETVWNKVCTGNFNETNIRWFVDAKLNATINCVDRHLAKYSEKTALIWEANEPGDSKSFTYQKLFEQVNQFANVLKRYKIKKGDTVCIYMPMVPETIFAMLACARIGAIHSVVFAGFSAEALKNRVVDAKAKLVITANESLRGKKCIPLKANVDQALVDCPSVKTVLVFARTNTSVNMQQDRDVWLHDCLNKESIVAHAEIMDAADPLFILYTSGSTGKPKGILHATAGYLVYAAITFKYVFNYQTNDVYWCTADVGWITGHTYTVYGPLLNAATIVIYEGLPDYPDSSRYWKIIDKYQVNIFYTAPTALRALRREGDDWVTKTNRKSLKILGTVGEPINPEVWQWYYDIVGEKRCYIVDTWWQTETGGIMISPVPGVTLLKPGSAAWPFFGVKAAIVDDAGKALPANQMGNLVIQQPWPGLMQTVFGDRQRFVETYFSKFPGNYLTGDQAYQDDDGYFWIAGRNDDVIKIAGHRIGTEEVESALVSHAVVSEAAVVAIANDIKGQSIYAFVTLKTGQQGSELLKKELIDIVKKNIGAIAIIEHIQWTNALPKTRSGKIMRRILRKIANNDVDDLGDLSTLTDPSIVDELIKSRDL